LDIVSSRIASKPDDLLEGFDYVVQSRGELNEEEPQSGPQVKQNEQQQQPKAQSSLSAAKQSDCSPLKATTKAHRVEKKSSKQHRGDNNVRNNNGPQHSSSAGPREQARLPLDADRPTAPQTGRHAPPTVTNRATHNNNNNYNIQPTEQAQSSSSGCGPFGDSLPAVLLLPEQQSDPPVASEQRPASDNAGVGDDGPQRPIVSPELEKGRPTGPQAGGVHAVRGTDNEHVARPAANSGPAPATNSLGPHPGGFASPPFMSQAATAAAAAAAAAVAVAVPNVLPQTSPSAHNNKELAGYSASVEQYAPVWRQPPTRPPLEEHNAGRMRASGMGHNYLGPAVGAYQQQQRKGQQLLLYDAPNVVEPPRSDWRCPMRGPITVCDQIAHYPADVILERLETAQKQLGKSYFNIESFFSDERDHLAEPFASELDSGNGNGNGRNLSSQTAPQTERDPQRAGGSKSDRDPALMGRIGGQRKQEAPPVRPGGGSGKAGNQALAYGRKNYARSANYVPTRGDPIIAPAHEGRPTARAATGRGTSTSGDASRTQQQLPGAASDELPAIKFAPAKGARNGAANAADEFLQLVERNGIPATIGNGVKVGQQGASTDPAYYQRQLVGDRLGAKLPVGGAVKDRRRRHIGQRPESRNNTSGSTTTTRASQGPKQTSPVRSARQALDSGELEGGNLAPNAENTNQEEPSEAIAQMEQPVCRAKPIYISPRAAVSRPQVVISSSQLVSLRPYRANSIHQTQLIGR